MARRLKGWRDPIGNKVLEFEATHPGAEWELTSMAGQRAGDTASDHAIQLIPDWDSDAFVPEIVASPSGGNGNGNRNREDVGARSGVAKCTRIRGKFETKAETN